MEIVVAKSAGFCFGVNNAVNMVYEMLETNGKQIYTFGPIIHNDQVVSYLSEKGVKTVEDINDINGKGHIVIRAHGVTPIIYKKIKDKGLILEDATCPYVKKIHNLVEEKSNQDYRIIIVGDRNHPEVIGINGWCNNSAYIVNSVDDAKLLKKSDKKICVVAQTTITKEKWHEINECLKEQFKNISKFDTICNATSKRQSEVKEISKIVDLMIIVGGKNSSNTQKLFDISKKHCAMTFKVQTSGDLPPIDVGKIKKIGISAGASTPDWVIEEVIKKMSELNNQETVKNEEKQDDINFADAFEDSFVRIQPGDIITGKVIGFNANEVFVDLGYKSDGIISLDEYTDVPDFKLEDDIKVGDEIEVFVQKINDGEGNVKLSKKQVDAIKSWDEIEKAYEDKTPVKAVVVEVVKGGVVTSCNGVRIFVPGSQLSDRYVKDLREYLKRTLELRIIDFNQKRRKLVGSARVLIEEKNKKASKEVWENIEEGKIYSGVVKSLTSFGAFVDIGGVDGLVHVSELSWSRVKHPSEVLKVGDTVEVFVLSFDKDKKKISLGYRKQEDNPWFKVGQMYKEGVIVTVKVLRMASFGAFVEIIKGVDGLVHISQISNKHVAKVEDVLKVGMEVDAKIIEMDIENKKISLSIKEVNPIDPTDDKLPKGEKKADEAQETEHKEDMGITLGDVVKTETDDEPKE
ncbi:bifunctional 4-hydroxy-3-methylbut-2-enyl diphosphate reductase/30S ribosomal protein S1 [Herbivorax sp. ANBcel31]|uniref:bifunctional 4-hydroxy-3-methylbut-2-enyl diphosphate reductase/30S ribosomal protein S1 n=1 Tax=Herbivorax sp. ANBcel31 TaxID=3069754 RepID=UPI0027B36DEE|nr:bifunctional 4-hydroxy-3-methylbut-2-enyl diphosphate reductase/30S ribosomal protein S1 [Herbivorax sp. ANBcel31]MDQ2085792.1 bifunctional 4-hydroxy-3-methylbut-2-enyl diphosphate reductase/30S ribosomal protein S1 [Herbivorax sp. ANBcel31]